MSENQFEVSPPTSAAVPDRGPMSFVLIPSFLLGPETWRGVGEILGRLGYESVIAAPSPTSPRDTDHIGPWVDQVVETALSESGLSEPAGPLVLVAHSTSCPRLALVARRLIDSGREVHTVIAVNGRVPWTDGETPIEADPTLGAQLDGMVRPNDYLPPWHRWWGSMILDMVPNEEIRKRVFSEAKPVPRALFDQPIEVPLLPDTVRWAFLATGKMYEPSYERAKDAGWRVARLDGEHLHIVVDPVTVAGILLSLIDQCDSEVDATDATEDRSRYGDPG